MLTLNHIVKKLVKEKMLLIDALKHRIAFYKIIVNRLNREIEPVVTKGYKINHLTVNNLLCDGGD